MMIFSIVRFAMLGWIEKQYLEPTFQFKYYGFEWVSVPPAAWLYAIYVVMLIGAIGIALGWYYRISAALFFFSFTYVELLDRTFYLNHYYFISLVSFLMVLMPAHRRCSLDVKSGRIQPVLEVENFYVFVLRLQVAIVYFFAGIAKINYDWLIRAMPMRLWLPANAHQPILGSLFSWKPLAYIFSWFGMIYDTTIVLFLSLRKTRSYAYLTVIIFHFMTAWLFPIGVFPIVMILSALIFFPVEWHDRLIGRLEQTLGFVSKAAISFQSRKFIKRTFALFMFFQILFPIRYLAYPGNLFWTEEGYMFSWRVMLTEKAGDAQFYVIDEETGKKVHVVNGDHLIPVQEKMMATKPDMILQYAKYLRKIWKERGFKNPIVTADVFVTLNGKRSKRLVDPNVDLAAQSDSWSTKTWILRE